MREGRRSRRGSRGRWGVAALLAAALAAGGCTGGGSAADQPSTAPPRSATPGHPALTASPTSSSADQPVSIKASGLPPGTRVIVRLAADADDVHWRSSATVVTSSTGTVDLDTDRSRGGSYQGVDGMGLVQTLAPRSRLQTTYFFWPGLGKALDFTVTVSTPSGGVLAKDIFRRTLGDGVHDTSLSVADQGINGVFYRQGKPGASGKRPAVLAFGGSEGGNSSGPLGAALAARGYPTLTLAYFHAPGVPKNLVDIPIEYFAKAARWLRQQPGVDPDRIYVLGISRGSEAAQLLGVHYPQLVHGVIASVPSNVVQSGLRGMTPVDKSAWSFRGRPVPFAKLFNTPDPPLVPESVIPVEKINGPMLLVCGGADMVWISCSFSRAIIDRLEEHHSPYRHVLAEYPEAGHGVGALLPYQPVGNPVSRMEGTNPLANQRAQADVWPKLLDFLQEK